LIYILLVLVALTLVPMALVVRSQLSDSPTPRIQVVPDMDDQQRFNPQAENALFADGRAMRAHVPGTVARGDVADEHFLTGMLEDEWAATNAVTVTRGVMHRGRERFDIFCAVCHGLAGRGDGLVAQRADALQEGTWTPPTDLASDVVRERPDGELFDIITSGIRKMPAYGAQIPVADRWAIVAYVRALQRSQGTSLADVPEAERSGLQ